MTAREVVAAINAAKLASPRDARTVVKDLAKVAIVDLKEHRWYVTGTIVYRCGHEFAEHIGVSGVVSVKSEEMGVKDCGVKVVAFEMEEVETVTYRKKQ